jgi:light-harvesting complex 1 beta chain
MEADMARKHAGLAAAHGGDPLNGYHVIFVVTFIAFLALAAVGQLLNRNWRDLLPGAEGSPSMWDGVRSAVYTVISTLS